MQKASRCAWPWTTSVSGGKAWGRQWGRQRRVLALRLARWIQEKLFFSPEKGEQTEPRAILERVTELDQMLPQSHSRGLLMTTTLPFLLLQ